MDFWPHQATCIRSTSAHIKAGYNAPCIVGPTGSGKSFQMRHIALKCAEAGQRILMPFHRRLLLRQFVQEWEAEGIPFGIIASEYPGRQTKDLIQLASTQTIATRLQRDDFYLPASDYAIWDELHQQTTDSCKSIRKVLEACNCKHIGFTATPVGIKDVADVLIQAGNYSDMIACGAHLPLKVYSPECPDFNELKAVPSWEITETHTKKLVKVKSIIGNLFDWWQRLNPWQLPAICFAPGVPESIWCVEEFARRGFRTAHIDAERIVFCRRLKTGRMELDQQPRSEDNLQELYEGSKNGTYKIVFNRFVLREGISWNHFYHVIAATTFGQVSSYLQAIGRVLRNYPGYDHKLFQDHGGSTYLHGLPNQDREWNLDDTDASIARALKKKREQEPDAERAEGLTCPKCGAVRESGPECPECGHRHKKGVRRIRMADGTLKKSTARLVKHKKPIKKDFFGDTLWSSAQRKNPRTVKAAYELAKRRMQDAGQEGPVKSRFALPEAGSVDWDKSVIEVYPFLRTFRKKRLKENA